MYFLETKDVVKQYAGHTALHKANIRVPHGKIFGLLGPNGAGKTTLIRIINRITAPDSGEVWFDGHLSQPNDIYRIGYLPEERGLYKKMKVGEQAIYLAQLKGLSYKDARQRLWHWFEKFEIQSWWHKKVEELSKGMQQRVQFIVTVVHEPELLIFDEPFSGFDPVNTEQLKAEILAQKAHGRTIIFSTHNMASVEEICDEIALIHASEVVLTGSVHEVRQQYKTNTCKLHIRNSSFQSSPDYDVLSETTLPHEQGLYIRIRKTKPISNSALLNALIPHYEICAFEEELPSMHEVFLQTVTRSQPKNQTSTTQ